MKGQQCSWRDMRKIKHILERKEKLQGEYDALVRCVDAGTVRKWKATIEVMGALRPTTKDFKHLQPEHEKSPVMLQQRNGRIETRPVPAAGPCYSWVPAVPLRCAPRRQ